MGIIFVKLPNAMPNLILAKMQNPGNWKMWRLPNFFQWVVYLVCTKKSFIQCVFQVKWIQKWWFDENTVPLIYSIFPFKGCSWLKLPIFDISTSEHLLKLLYLILYTSRLFGSGNYIKLAISSVCGLKNSPYHPSTPQICQNSKNHLWSS